jgi:hypothetical protein
MTCGIICKCAWLLAIFRITVNDGSLAISVANPGNLVGRCGCEEVIAVRNEIIAITMPVSTSSLQEFPLPAHHFSLLTSYLAYLANLS